MDEPDEPKEQTLADKINEWRRQVDAEEWYD